MWQQIGANRPFLHVSGMFPVERGCLGLVWPLAPHPTNKNELIVWDLSQDPQVLEGLDADAVRLVVLIPSAGLSGIRRFDRRLVRLHETALRLALLDRAQQLPEI